MNEIRTLIVDDEPLARRGIRQMLSPYTDLVVVGECRDGREAVRALTTMEPDLVFLDVEMPGLDGLGVVRVHGADRMPATVFVTAHDHFAVRAFEAQALDYLVKPISERRFRQTVSRVRERLRMNDALSLASQLSALLEGQSSDGAGVGAARDAAEIARSGGRRSGARIAVRTETGKLLLDAEEIDWLEAQDYEVVVHSGGVRHRLRQTLGALERRLDPARFCRVHRSAIVRLDGVRELTTDGSEGAVLTMADGSVVPVSRRRLAGVRSLLRSEGGGP